MQTSGEIDYTKRMNSLITSFEKKLGDIYTLKRYVRLTS